MPNIKQLGEGPRVAPVDVGAQAGRSDLEPCRRSEPPEEPREVGELCCVGRLGATELNVAREEDGWQRAAGKGHDELIVKQGIVSGHVTSERGIEVDKAKVETVEQLPPPTDVKSLRSFLGHARFYRRSIKDFSMITKPLTQLLQKDVAFDCDEKCLAAFRTLKNALVSAPIIQPPD
jgi:hypothetical protein